MKFDEKTEPDASRFWLRALRLFQAHSSRLHAPPQGPLAARASQERVALVPSGAGKKVRRTRITWLRDLPATSRRS